MNVGVGLVVDKQILNVCKLGTFIVGNHWCKMSGA